MIFGTVTYYYNGNVITEIANNRLDLAFFIADGWRDIRNYRYWKAVEPWIDCYQTHTPSVEEIADCLLDNLIDNLDRHAQFNIPPGPANYLNLTRDDGLIIHVFNIDEAIRERRERKQRQNSIFKILEDWPDDENE